MSNKKGFTLVELIVVTAIISILFTISYTSYRGYHQKSRAYSAKKDLSSIISMAETFKANTGFYIPDLRKMHVPIQGRYSYNYKIVCHTDGTIGNVYWGATTTVGTCGSFTPSIGGGTPPIPPTHLNTSTSCASAKCWMGAVLCHHYKPGASISCGSEDYAFEFADRGIMQWKPYDEDWTSPNTILKNQIAPLFNIVDFASKKDTDNDGRVDGTGDKPYCKRVSRKDDVFAESNDCFFNAEHAMDSADISSNSNNVIMDFWTGDEEAYVSTPFKLAVTAVGCKDSQKFDPNSTPPSSGCKKGTGVEYSIIRMDTNRLVKIVQ